MIKSYEDGMTSGGEGLHAKSEFALNHSTGEETLGGRVANGRNVPVSLSDTNPVNETEIISDGAVKENRPTKRSNP